MFGLEIGWLLNWKVHDKFRLGLQRDCVTLNTIICVSLIEPSNLLKNTCAIYFEGYTSQERL